MAKNLLIVESPAKAKTIEKYLGEDFIVKSSYGHVRDLVKKNAGIDVENEFTPTYEISKDKEAVVKDLKKSVKKAEEVWLATDEDREGEAISWHLAEVLDLDPKETKRIVFREITKPAIQKAIKEPRTIDFDQVNAQQARRVLDRLVGFELSPLLWRKVQPKLSAGRVQSVAVRIVVEREREIEGFTPVPSFKVSALFLVTDENGKTTKLKADSGKKWSTEEEAEAFLNSLKGASYNIKDIQVKPGKRSPTAPFTTSTMQQEASRKLGYSVSKTMMLAQRLYEAGKISYMRTDSVNLSETAVKGISEQILNAYGEEYLQNRTYKNKNSNAQEAHEAIRPTDFSKMDEGAEADQKKLYKLIWQRTVSSQMSDAKTERTTLKIANSNNDALLNASGTVIKFDGFLKVYEVGKDEDNSDETADGILPPVKVGQELKLDEMTAIQRFSRPPARYTEATLVKKLEELGIGRPSTYAPIISTIQRRGYVTKDQRDGVERKYSVLTLKEDNVSKVVETETTGAISGRLHPTDVGKLVNDFLKENFENIMDYNFTADIEKEFDLIANGSKNWNDPLKEFFGPFHKKVEHTLEHSERVTGKRVLGTDPKSGKEVCVRLGRFGPMVQIGDVEDEEKPRFAGLRPGQKIETITYEEAMILFKLPRTVGEFEDKEVKVNIGRFGPYILHDSKFTSLKKEYDPYKVSLEEAITLILEKREADAKKLIKEWPEHEIQVLHGRWGPYIKQGKKNVRIPKEQKDTAGDLTLETVLEMIENAPEKGAKKTAAKKTTKKSTAKKSTTKKKTTTKKSTTKTSAKKKSE